jgi:alpha-L-arabinofuranosidase
LAITEYNGGITGNDPVPYRHCLGTALLNAELLRIFMKPEHEIIMANYWQFCNSYWGMVANGFDDIHNFTAPYYKRPNYYVYELYHNHFGDILIKSEVVGVLYNIRAQRALITRVGDKIENVLEQKENYQVPYLSINSSKSGDGTKIYLMVVNRNQDEGITATVGLEDFLPSGEVNVWILNGPSIDATNEETRDNVKVTHKKIEIQSSNFDFTFEPHSLTAIEIKKHD